MLGNACPVLGEMSYCLRRFRQLGRNDVAGARTGDALCSHLDFDVPSSATICEVTFLYEGLELCLHAVKTVGL